MTIGTSCAAPAWIAFALSSMSLSSSPKRIARSWLATGHLDDRRVLHSAADDAVDRPRVLPDRKLPAGKRLDLALARLAQRDQNPGRRERRPLDSHFSLRVAALDVEHVEERVVLEQLVEAAPGGRGRERVSRHTGRRLGRCGSPRAPRVCASRWTPPCTRRRSAA